MKSKRKLALAVIMALIVSMLPMTVFAGSAQPEDGEYLATFYNTSKSNHKISMAEVGYDYFSYSDTDGSVKTDGDGEISATVSGGVITAHINFCNYGNTVTHIYTGSKSDDADTKDAGAIAVVDGKFDLVVNDGAEKEICFKTSNGWNVKGKTTPNAINIKVTLGEKGGKRQSSTTVISEGHALNLTITRQGNVSEANKGTSIRNRFAVSKVENGTVYVTIEGGFAKMYMGTYEKAEAAEASSDEKEKAKVVTLPASDGKVTLSFDRPQLGTPIKVAMFSGSMNKWYDYDFTFSSKACVHAYGSDGICTKCGAVSMTNSEAFKVSEEKIEVNSAQNTKVMLTKEVANAFKEAKEPVEITNKVGKVSFDKDAITAIFGGKTFADDIKFEMKDIKSDAAYADSDYDMVLDLTLEDAFGNNLFAEGTNGKATITVPYDKEVPEGKTVLVYYITKSGREEVEATYDAASKTVTFEVEHFSVYALEQGDAAVTVVKSPNTGDNTLVFLFVGLMMLGGVAFVATKKGLIK